MDKTWICGKISEVHLLYFGFAVYRVHIALDIFYLEDNKDEMPEMRKSTAIGRGQVSLPRLWRIFQKENRAGKGGYSANSASTD